MKASKVIILLIPLLFCQCASYKLYREDVYRNGKLVDRTTYKYEDGQLSSKVDVNYYTFDGKIHKDYSTTDYQVRITDSGIDSIKMRYHPIGDTSVVVRSFNPQGIIQSRKEYSWGWNGREEISNQLYDSKGNLIEEEESRGINHTRYIRDSLNRVVVMIIESASYESIDSTFYSFDGRHTTIIKRNWNDKRGLIGESKTVYEPDEKGLILLDSTAQRVIRYEYELDGKGRVRSRVVSYTFADKSRQDLNWKNEYRYDLKGRNTYTRSYDLTADPPYKVVNRKVYRFGRLIKRKGIKYQSGEKTLTDYDRYRYNLRGQIVEEIYKEGDNQESTKYTYKRITH